MPADYVIINSTPFQFNYRDPGVGGEMDKSFEFTLPAGAKVDSNSILFWFAEFQMVSGASWTWRININTKEVSNRIAYSGTPPASFHTVIGANVLKEAGNMNNIEFEIQGSGGGNFKFYDIYLMIQI
jgi:hypothetical protein